MSPTAAAVVASIAAAVALLALFGCAFLLWRVLGFARSAHEALAYARALDARLRQLTTPVHLDRTDANAMMDSAVQQGDSLFHQARASQGHLDAARARIQAECPHIGVKPGGHCDACNGTRPTDSPPGA